MRKIIIAAWLLLAVLLLPAFQQKSGYRIESNTSFEEGEELQFRVHYGIFNAGKATIQVHKDLYKVNDRPCYRVNVFGKSVGAFRYMKKIEDTWRSYIDTAALVPQKFFKNVEEGNYTEKQAVYFDHINSNAVIHRMKKGEKKDPKNIEIPSNVQDIVSGYYYLRALDLKSMKPGDTIVMDALVDQDVYKDNKIKYAGTEELKVNGERFSAHRLVPLIPENRFFSGKRAVEIWLSNDANKIPLKVKAKIFVGAVEISINGYSGLKHPLNKI